jgi:four helix bundle suffix protein
MTTDGQKQRAMRSDAARRVYGKHGGYRNLKAYQVAELLYDFTCRFCDRYIPVRDRHHDQLVQAARSGYQNIAEGSEDSATSKKLEMNLTNVARSSQDEARKDYLKHLKRRGLRHWQEGAPAFDEARNLRPKTLEEAAAWVNRPGAAEPVEERAANLGAILAAQAHWLTERLLDRLARDFEKDGGFSERLYRARMGGNGRNGQNGRRDALPSAPPSSPPSAVSVPSVSSPATSASASARSKPDGFQACHAKPDGRSMVKEHRARYIVRRKGE